MKHILVVGGGLSAAALVASLRRRGFTGDVTVLCAEPHLPYDRPPLSKELFDHDQPSSLLEQFSLTDDDATWVLGTAGAALVPGGVTDSNGRLWEADEIVLAPGIAARSPWPNPFTLYTWSDAVALRAAIERSQSVAIVGGGWLGLELSSVAAEHGCRVTVIDLAPTPLGTVLPPAVSERIQGWLDAAGVEFLGGRRVADADSHRVVTVDGAEVEADTVIVSLGSAPQTQWLPDDLLLPSGHVVTDQDGRVREGLWAIGDCAAPGGAAHPHWNDAIAAAERCAAALVGDEPPVRRPPNPYSVMFGHDFEVLGEPSPTQDAEITETPTGWLARLTHEGALKAMFVVDTPREVGKARKALLAASANES